MNDEQGAAGALAAAAVAALRRVPGLSQVSDGAPLQAGDGHAVVEAGPETDWGHKSGAGAEVRFAVRVACAGEQPGRTRMLLERVRGALDGLEPGLGGWRIVSLAMMRARVVRTAGPGWAGVAEYRARMLRD